jgi:hypothetical protein
MRDRLLGAFWIMVLVLGISLRLHWDSGEMAAGLILLLLVAALVYRALLRAFGYR